MSHRFSAFLLVLLAAGCVQSSEESLDGSIPGDATVDGDSTDAGRCLGPGGEDLGPLEPPTDACAVADRAPDHALAAAACRALGPFVRGEFTEPFDLLLGDVTARRFGVSALSDLWPSYQSALVDTPTVELRTYARIGDPAAEVTPEDLAMLGGIDEYTGPALHCRDHPLPSDYAETLGEALSFGGYPATHVLMALFWLDDLGCAAPTDHAFFEAAVAATAGVIDDDHAITSDLEIEAAAFLSYLGEDHLIPAGFLEAVITNQHAGGGWAAFTPSDPPYGHTSGLALWYLHEALFPGRTTTMVTRCVRAASPD